MDQVAQTYVRLTLAVGQHDPNYVDAYYGPPEWKGEAAGQPMPLDRIREEARAARASLAHAEPSDEMSRLRWTYLTKQLDALIARVGMLSGEKWSFDEESAALYDVVDPGRPDAYYQAVLDQLEPLLPGSEPLCERYDRFRSQFFVPPEKLETVFGATVEAARERTKRFIPMPAEESFRIEYVKDQVWGAYNWYEGDAHSLIQVNTDFPIAIDRVVGLACHEGYPGHHVYNALLEQHLARERNWVEFSVYALFSPQSLIAEGTAEYGVELNYPREERLAFERETLYPLAGLDPGHAEEYAQMQSLLGQLGYSSNDAARRYLDGKASHAETVDWLVTYSLSTPSRAAQRIRFFEQNRSYVVTYNLGQDLVRSYVEGRATTREDRWKVFARLLSTPQVPSGLR